MKNTQIPIARKEGLVIQEMPEELLVYDMDTNKAHCLNDTASKVWKACDGKNSVADIATMLKGNQGNEDMVWLAIEQLHENELLEKEYKLETNGINRREVIKKVGLASMVALPIVASLTAPSSALAAASCACVNPIDCAPQNTCPSTVNCAPTGICSP